MKRNHIEEHAEELLRVREAIKALKAQEEALCAVLTEALTIDKPMQFSRILITLESAQRPHLKKDLLIAKVGAKIVAECTKVTIFTKIILKEI